MRIGSEARRNPQTGMGRFASLLLNAASGRRDCDRGFLRFGRDLSVDYRDGKAARAQYDLADERSVAHVWAGTSRSIYGAAGRKWVGSRRLGTVPPAQLGALGRDAGDDHRHCMARAQDLNGRNRSADPMARTAIALRPAGGGAPG